MQTLNVKQRSFNNASYNCYSSFLLSIMIIHIINVHLYHQQQVPTPWRHCPHGQKIASPPQEFCVNFFEAVEGVNFGMSALYTTKMYSKSYECHCGHCNKRCADFSLRMHQKHLVAGIRPDQLGKLAVLS